MSNYKKFFRMIAPLVLVALCNMALAAQDIQDAVCGVLEAIYTPLLMIGASLVLLMITYAGVRYVYSADDPGGRKQAKSMIVNAIIGGILLMIAVALSDLATNNIAAYCPNM